MDIKVNFLDYSFVSIECEESTFYELREYFSFKADGYQFHPKFKYGGWSGNIYLLDYDRKLPYGLAGLVRKFAENMGYSVWTDPRIFEREDITREEFDKWVNGLEIYAGGNRITPHWYQADAVFEAIKNRRQILNLPTSAGKSLIQCLITRWFLENYDKKVLIIVPTTSLVTQMIDDFVDYGLFPRQALHGIKSGSPKYTDALVVVSTWQSAVKLPQQWLEQFGCIMNDECHLSTGASIKKIIQNSRHIPYKFGLSGSLREGKCNIMQYVGMFGDIFKPVTTAKLMEDGQVTDLKINALFLRYPDPETVAMKGKEYKEEIKYITEHKKRNAVMCNLAIKLAQQNQNAFLMFKHVKHGKALFDYLQKKYDPSKVFYVSGEVKTAERDALKKMAENDTGLIVVASYGVFSTGISIKNLHHVIFAHPVKSAIIVKQSIGRVLRKHGSKSIATVWDIIDHLGVKPKSANAKKKFVSLNYSLKHALERIKIYNDEKFDYTMKTIEL